MNPVNAATEIIANLPDISQSERDENGGSINHANWMLHGIAFGYIQGDKAHRWLGYAQGLLVVHGTFTLEQMKRVNKGMGVGPK